jgi:hypothetical protein
MRDCDEVHVIRKRARRPIGCAGPFVVKELDQCSEARGGQYAKLPVLQPYADLPLGAGFDCFLAFLSTDPGRTGPIAVVADDEIDRVDIYIAFERKS